MKRLMAMLATLALVAAALTSCDKDDPKPKPQPLDPSYLPGKTFKYEKKVGNDSKEFSITFAHGADPMFQGMKGHFIDKPGADRYSLGEAYEGIYTIQGNKITTKLRRHVRNEKVGDNEAAYEHFNYEAGQEPVLFEDAEVDAAQGTITLRAWDQTIVLKLAPTPA